MIVVDTNVIAYMYLPSEHTAAAEALLERDPEWAAPILWRSELRNILAGYVRRKTLTLDQAYDVQHEAESLLEGSEFEVDSHAVLKLVKISDCSAHVGVRLAYSHYLDWKWRAELVAAHLANPSH